MGRRDWSPVMARLRRRSYRDLPLTSAARALTEELDRLRRGRQDPAYRKDIRTLTILVYWLGAETVVQGRDVHDLALLDPDLAAKRVCQFLAARGLPAEDPELHRDADQVWVESTIGTLPPTVADEVRLWVKALRGQDRREHEALSYDGIRRYRPVRERQRRGRPELPGALHARHEAGERARRGCRRETAEQDDRPLPPRVDPRDDMTRVGDGTARHVPDGALSASRARPGSAVMPGAGARAE